MKANLLTIFSSAILSLCTLQTGAQSLNAGDIYNNTKGNQNIVMAYTPCPVLTSTINKIDQVNCLTLTNGSATLTAGGGVPSYYYTWFGPRTYAPITLPAFTNTYTASQARGFWFTSPTTTVITGIRVPSDIGTANQFVYVVKWSSTPPAYPASGSNYSVLGRYLDVPGNDTIKCGIPINTGDIIGVLGVRGSTASANSSMSYGAGGYVTSISGFTTTLFRFMNQTDITTNNIGVLSEGGTGSIGRVELYFGSSISQTKSALNLPGGNYSCFYTDTNGCMTTSTISIAPGATITSANSFTNPTCASGNNGQALVSPSAGTAPYTYSWSPSGGTASLATGLSLGTYSCLITDSKSNCAVTTVTLGLCTGINELSQITNSLVYPNPSNGIFLIKGYNEGTLEIYNSLGEKIMNKRNITGEIKIDSYPSGLYYLKIESENQTEYIKIIKN